MIRALWRYWLARRRLAAHQRKHGDLLHGGTQLVWTEHGWTHVPVETRPERFGGEDSAGVR